MENNNKKRKIISYWILGILAVGLIAVFSFKTITGNSRSVGDDAIPDHQEQKILRDLESQNLPVNQKENVR